MADEMVNSIGRRTLLSALSTAALGAAAMTSGKRVALANDQIVKTNAVVPSVCVFDVNETLLDIDSIAPLFQRIFGDRKAVREWFGQLILYSNAITLSGPDTSFFTLGQGVLKMMGTIYKVPVTDADVDELRTRMLTMPAHPDVSEGLKRLKDAGFRLVTCTNSPPDPQANPLKHAGLDVWFEASFSIDRRRVERSAICHLHGGGARLGHSRCTKRWLLGGAHCQTGQCSSTSAWNTPAECCRF